ncbi:MAG: hypothetical protein Q9184_004697 [Pyrenodesmia sp. 2 TL-2023]
MRGFKRYLNQSLPPPPAAVDTSTHDEISNAISTNNPIKLRSLLETQDRHLYTQLAQHGSPETTAFVLSRHPNAVPPDFSEHLATSDPIHHPHDFLVREAAYNGNAHLFRYLVTEYHLLSHNRNIEYILFGAITGGGIPIWKIILELEPQWKDHEFYEHHGVVLEKVVEYGGPDKKDLLQFLLEEGADLGGVTEPPLETFRALGAGKEILEMVERYC